MSLQLNVGGTRCCRGWALVWPPQTAQGVQEPQGSLHRDVSWSVKDARVIPSEGWQGERNTSPRKVSESRTSEVCRRNPTRLNTLHNLQSRSWSFSLKIKARPLVSHPLNVTFVKERSEIWPAHKRDISKSSAGLWLWHLLLFQGGRQHFSPPCKPEETFPFATLRARSYSGDLEITEI